RRAGHGRVARLARRTAGLALFRPAGRLAGAGLLRAGLLRRYRAGQFPLAVAGLSGPAATAARGLGAVAAMAAGPDLAERRAGIAADAGLLRFGIGAGRACA